MRGLCTRVAYTIITCPASDLRRGRERFIFGETPSQITRRLADPQTGSRTDDRLCTLKIWIQYAQVFTDNAGYKLPDASSILNGHWFNNLHLTITEVTSVLAPAKDRQTVQPG